jgi:HK97 family phage major capsid protein
MTLEMKEMLDLTRQLGDRIEEKHVQFDARVGKIEAALSRPNFGGDLSPEGKSEEAKAVDAWARSGTLDTKALSIVTDGNGVVVRGDWSSRIFSLVRETSPMRQLANVMQTAQQSLEVLVDRGEPGSGWVAETGSRTATAESFLTRHPIATHEHYAYPAITNQLLADSTFDVEGWLQGKIGARFGREEASSFMTGDGTGQARGILDYTMVPDAEFVWGADPALYEIGAIYTGQDGALGTNALNHLADLVDALKADYLPGASFLMTRAMRNQIRKLKDADGRFLYQASLDAAIPDRLMGYPVRLAEDMPTLAADVVGILFGDFRQAYTIVDRSGIQVIRDPFTQPGFVKYYVSKRVGGAVTNPEAVKALVLGAEPE